MSLQGGWDRDSQAKKGGMAGLTGKMGGKAGSEKPIGDPHMSVDGINDGEFIRQVFGCNAISGFKQ